MVNVPCRKCGKTGHRGADCLLSNESACSDATGCRSDADRGVYYIKVDPTKGANGEPMLTTLYELPEVSRVQPTKEAANAKQVVSVTLRCFNCGCFDSSAKLENNSTFECWSCGMLNRVEFAFYFGAPA